MMRMNLSVQWKERDNEIININQEHIEEEKRERERKKENIGDG